MKKYILVAVSMIIVAAFILMPIKGSDVILRFDTDTLPAGNFELYYMTDASADFDTESVIEGTYDEIHKQISFRIPAITAVGLKGLRLDMPYFEEYTELGAMTISSAGVIKKEIAPYKVFVEDKVIRNDLVFSNIEIKNQTYFTTTGNDAYVVFLPETVAVISKCQSSYRVTRALLVLFVYAVVLLAFIKKRNELKTTDVG